MTSKPSSDCCLKASIHEGTPAGKIEQFGGVDAYITGEKTGKVILFITDVYGHTFKNSQLVADGFTQCGFQVIVPDLFNGEPVPFPPPDGYSLPKFFEKHPAEKVDAIVEKVLGAIKQDNPSFIGATGYCFGGKYAIRLLADTSKIDAAAIAHPTAVTEDEVRAVKNPLFIAAAETDNLFTAEFRHLSEKILIENKTTFYMTLASKCEHGFSIKGDMSKPHVRFAKEKCLKDFCEWFKFVDSLKQ